MAAIETGLVYAAVSALMLGVYMFFIKRYVAHYPATVYVALTYLCSLVWYVPIALVTVDGGYVPAGAGLETLGILAFVVLGSSLAVLASFRAISLGDVSYVAPISKLIPVFVVPVEVLLLQQHLTPLQLGGVVVATAAVYVANYEPGKLVEPLRQAARSRPAQFALASAAAFGVTDVGKRVLTQELQVAPETVNLALFVGLPLALAPLALRRIPGGVRGDAGTFLGLGLLLAVAEHLVMLAFSTLPASLASPVINSSAVVTVVLGGIVLGEEAMHIRLTAAGCAIVGVTLISLG
ncbi:MAG: DMT family transporter [Haloarculaceae archaeon]